MVMIHIDSSGLNVPASAVFCIAVVAVIIVALLKGK